MKKYLTFGVGLLAAVFLTACSDEMGMETKSSSNQATQNAVGQIAVGQEAPDFTLKSMDGKTVKLSDYKGKKVYLKFWASWCGPCKKSMPELIELAGKKDRDFEILSVIAPGIQGEKSETDFPKWFEEQGYKDVPDDPEWVEKVAEITGAVSGDTYVKLDHGILTVNQIDMFLKAMPFELTYADDNNQFLYYNNAHQDPDTMFAKRVPPQSGSRMSTVHGSLPPARMKNVEWVIGTLRNGNQEYVRTIVPGSPAGVINTHNYQAMYYPDGSYAGINEIVFNFQPWLEWYLETTGQQLVGGSGPFAPAGGQAKADATSGASDAGSHSDNSTGEADATSGASSR